ncbi:MAG TPA: hypothetical protein ENH82_03190 [bacterium]|nr:hypothetical protein [bacterium]
MTIFDLVILIAAFFFLATLVRQVVMGIKHGKIKKDPKGQLPLDFGDLPEKKYPDPFNITREGGDKEGNNV